jgi:hypothetical protein
MIAMIDYRRLVLDVALQIYSRFGWNDPPKKELEEAQQKRFGREYIDVVEDIPGQSARVYLATLHDSLERRPRGSPPRRAG